MHFFHNNFFPVYNILLWEKIVKLLCLCVPCILFSGQKSYEIYLVVLTLGVRIMLFSYEGAEVLETESFSLLLDIIYSNLWAFGSTHGMKAALPQRMLSIPPAPPNLLNYDWNWRLPTLTIYSKLSLSLTIASNQFIEKYPSPSTSFILIFIYWRPIRYDC